LIDVPAGQTGEDAVARLADVPEAGGRRRAVAFQERLARVLFGLDREEPLRQPSDSPTTRWTANRYR
jgi:hypothetical protein